MIVSSILLSQGAMTVECAISDFTDHAGLVEAMKKSLAGQFDLGEIKPRFSRTLNRSYMSNGCVHCDALFGQHFEIQARYAEQDAARITVSTPDEWDEMLRELLASEDGHLFRF